jgi:hypothetical protein
MILNITITDVITDVKIIQFLIVAMIYSVRIKIIDFIFSVFHENPCFNIDRKAFERVDIDSSLRN